MSTKAKTKKANSAELPSKQSSKPAANASPDAPEFNIKVVRAGSCPSLKDTGVLDYEVGADGIGQTYFRITANNAGGFWSKEWVAWNQILYVFTNHEQITSIQFRGLFKGKSVNSAGFLVAALKDQGLLERKPGKTRYYQLTQEALKLPTKPA